MFAFEPVPYSHLEPDGEDPEEMMNEIQTVYPDQIRLHWTQKNSVKALHETSALQEVMGEFLE